MQIIDSISEFIIDQKIRGNSKNTLSYYRYVLKKFVSMGAVFDTDQITLNTCRDFYIYLSEQNINSVSVQSYIRGFRAYLSWLYNCGYTSVDLPAKFKLPKARRDVIDILTDKELSILIHSFGDSLLDIRNLCICSLMFDCGLRLNEVVQIRISSLHLEERYLIVLGKGNKQRYVPIGENTFILLCKYISIRPRGDMLFLTLNGDAITEATIKLLFRRLKVKTGISRLHPHLLRHTFATKYLENGGNIYSLQAILGHSSLDMVKRYLHLANSRIRSDFGKFSPFDTLSKAYDFLPITQKDF